MPGAELDTRKKSPFREFQSNPGNGEEERGGGYGKKKRRLND